MNLKIILILFFCTILFFFLHPLGGDGDFFHHLNTGRYVLEYQSLPHTDQFTHTANGQPWVGYAWGAGIIFYLIYSNFGPLGINLFITTLVTITFILLYLLLKIYKIPFWARLLTLAIAAPAVSIRWPNRPELFTYPFVISTLLIDQYRVQNPRLSFLFPVIFLLWANIYGSSVFIGLVILGIILIKQILSDHFKLHKRNKLFYLMGILSFPISFINGYDWKTVFYILFIPQIAHSQTEWAGIIKNLTGPPDYVLFFQYWLIIYLIYLGFYLLLITLSWKEIRTKPLLVLFSLAVFIPFFAFRHIVLGIILSIPLIGFMIAKQNNKKLCLIRAVGIVIVVISGLISLWVTPRGVGQQTDPYAPQMIEFIKKHALFGRAFNNQQIGGFLTYYLYPDVLVYTDTRDDLYLNTPVLTDFYNILSSKQSIIPLLEERKIDIVIADLADGPSLQPLFYSNNWVPVFMLDHYVIVIPKKLALEKNLKILDAIDPFDDSGAKQNKEEDALIQYQEILKYNPNSWNTNMRLSFVYLSLEQFDQAIALASKIDLPSAPKHSLFASQLDYLLASAFFAKKDCINTKEYLDKTRGDVSGKLIFRANQNLPSTVNKGYAFYYLTCEKNKQQAENYLKLYLKQIDIPISEKTQTQNQFYELVTKDIL